MEKIVFNLIGNAFKCECPPAFSCWSLGCFNPLPDTLVGSIEVEVVYAEKTASIIVRDTGVGIPNKGARNFSPLCFVIDGYPDLVKIFDRFHR